jgi:hypothetical protein
MKKSFIILSLICCTLASAVAQGTIAFGNNVGSRFRILDVPGGRNITAEDGFSFGVFFGPAGTFAEGLQQAPGTRMIGPSTPGILTDASLFTIPGTEAGQVVSLQIRVLDSRGNTIGNTDVRQVTLAQPLGPGTVIWQGPSGTNPNRFHPIVLLPEPSTIALWAMAGVVLLFRVHRLVRTH